MSMIQTFIEYMENNKIIIVLVIAVAVYLWYTKVYYEGMGNSEEDDDVREEGPFIASKEFVGEKEGFVFKEGDNGLGYYIDN